MFLCALRLLVVCTPYHIYWADEMNATEIAFPLTPDVINFYFTVGCFRNIWRTIKLRLVHLQRARIIATKVQGFSRLLVASSQP